jgi:hypothetical protein
LAASVLPLPPHPTAPANIVAANRPARSFRIVRIPWKEQKPEIHGGGVPAVG